MQTPLPPFVHVLLDDGRLVPVTASPTFSSSFPSTSSQSFTVLPPDCLPLLGLPALPRDPLYTLAPSSTTTTSGLLGQTPFLSVPTLVGCGYSIVEKFSVYSSA